jgi:hypothetical protein
MIGSRASISARRGGSIEDLRQLLRGLEVFAGEPPTFDPATAPGTRAELFTE